MAFITKEWKDRLVEFAGRRKLTNVATGEETIVDVARNEGAVSQEGDAFSATNMNGLEQRIKNEFDSLNTNLNTRVSAWYDGNIGVTAINAHSPSGNKYGKIQISSEGVVFIGTVENNVETGYNLNDKFVSDIYVGSDGKLHKVQGGADSVLPFNEIASFDKITTNSFGAIIGKRYIISFMCEGMSDDLGNVSGISLDHITLYGGNGGVASWTVTGIATGTTITISRAIQYPQGMCVIRLS